jgi:hypothetical protein
MNTFPDRLLSRPHQLSNRPSDRSPETYGQFTQTSQRRYEVDTWNPYVQIGIDPRGLKVLRTKRQIGGRLPKAAG